ncbi:MAG TPA: SGNH/GDSL hydrolase family protein [Acidimicrobiia bacterium]
MRSRALAVTTALLVLAGSGVVNPLPAAGAPAAGTLHVTLLGDSLMWVAGKYVRRALASHGQRATVENASFPGVGLLDRGEPATDESFLPAEGIVVIEFTGNCLRDFGCTAEQGSESFYDAWEGALHSLVEAARHKGLGVVLVKPPPDRDEPLATISRRIADVSTSEPGVTIADWWRALTDPAGAYQDTLRFGEPGAAPAAHVVRDADGVHLTEAGARRVASSTAIAILAELHRCAARPAGRARGRCAHLGVG